MLETSELVGWCVLEAHVQGQAAAAMALSVLRGFGPTKQSLHSKLEDFKSEIKKNRRWYREGRREVKPLRHRCRRIVRLRVQALHAEAPTRSDAQQYDGKSSTPLQKTFAPSPVTGPLEMEASGAGHAPGRLADAVRDDPSRAAVGHSPSHVSARDRGMTLDYFNVMSVLLFLRFSSAAEQSSLRTHIAPTLVYTYIYIYTYIFRDVSYRPR